MTTPNPARGELAILRRDAEIKPAGTDAKARTFEVTWTQGAKVKRRRWDWQNDRIVEFTEELDTSPEAVDMSRLASGRAPVLDTHGSWALADVIGVVEKATLDGATIRLSDAEGDSDILRKVQDGIIRNISVGYSVEQWEIIKKDGEPEQWIARKWTPYELSLVPMGADAEAHVRSLEEKRDRQGSRLFTCNFSYRDVPESQPAKEQDMTDKNRGSGGLPDLTRNQPPAPPSPPAPPVDLEAERKAAREAETKRVQEIRKAVRAFGFPETDADAFIESGESIDQVRAKLQDKLAEQSDKTRQLPHVRGGGQDERETMRRLAENALTHRANPGAGVKLEDGARQFRGLTLMEFARAYLQQEGFDLRGLQRMEVAGLAVGLDLRMMGRSSGMHSTSDFPLILANVANKRLRDAYEAQASAWRLFCRQSNSTDFKAKYVTQLSEAPRLEKVPEHGAYKYGKMSEAGVNYALATYGKIIAITRQAIINDDLGAFDRIPRMMGQAAADNEADIVWAIITSNPNMPDGVPLFHATHGNLAGAAAALDIGPLGLARAAMRIQKNIGGQEFINVMPSYLLLPAALETKAEQVIAQNLIPNVLTNVVPEWMRSLVPIVEPRLDANSVTAWYLAAKPERLDTIEYAYLEGQEGVYTEQRIGFEVDGIELKARHDFAAKAIDHRGFYKNAGA